MQRIATATASSSTRSGSAALPASATGSTGPASPVSRPARWAIWLFVRGPKGIAILTTQDPAVRDGGYDYVARGHMIAGFALVAFPAQYGVSGVMTFIVNHEGVMYEKDLRPSTRSIGLAMRKFNPDGTWTKAEIRKIVDTAVDAPR